MVKAAIYSAYGSADVVKLAEIEKPVPADDEVLLKIHAASINAPDWRMLSGKPLPVRLFFGLRKPKIRPGTDVAGVVEAVGKNVTRFKPGDAVFGVCRGSFAEYSCTKESRLVAKPANVTFEQAAATPVCGLTALQALRDKGGLQPSQRVLINGASGGVGTFAVQIAKALGAHVTGVCSSGNVELVRSLGADRVIDYTKTDFTKGSEQYDLIVDVVASHPFASYRRILKPNGVCVIAGAAHRMTFFGLLKHMLVPMYLSRTGNQKFITFIAKVNTRDLETLAQMLASGTLTPAIDRRYPLDQVAQGLGYVDAGHAHAKVTIVMVSLSNHPE